MDFSNTMNVLRNILIMLCFSCSFLAIAQDPVSISENTSYAQIIDSAYELRSANPPQAQKLLQSVNREELSSLQRDRYDYIQAYLLYINGDIAGSIIAYEAMAKQASSIDQKFAAYASLVNLYAGTQNWSDGFKGLEYLSDNISKLESVEAEEHGHLAAINFYNAIDELESTVRYIEPLLNGEYSLRFTCMINMHRISAINEIDFTRLNEQVFTDLLEKCEVLNEPIMQLGTYQEFANYYLRKEQFDSAYQLISTHLAFAKKVNYKPLSDAFNEILSKSYLAFEDYDKAREHAELILQDENKGLFSKVSSTAYETLSKVAVSKGDYRGALEYYKKYFEANSFVLNKENAKMFSIQQAKQDSAEKSNKIALLDRENSLLKANAMLDEQAAQNRQLVYIIVLVLLISVAFWLYKSRSNYAKLQKISRVDELTGIANRHYFTNYSMEMASNNEQENRPISFVMFDLDDFKKINDNFGHRIGDIALQCAANAAKAACRKNDLIGRLGGEEFGIILDDCSIERAQEVAQACRTEIERTKVSDDFEIKLTASFGIASSELVGYEFDDLFDGADKALYESKRKGKNTVSVMDTD